MRDNVDVSCVFLAYNQEKFVRQALGSLLKQDFSPMEIIISDDCSDDRTFEVINDMVSTYYGPNQLILNRNKTNLGLIKHFNEVVARTSGRLIVFFGGDDISLPYQVSRIVDVWNNGNGPSCIGCNPIVIDENGKERGPFMVSAQSDFSLDAVIARGSAWCFPLAYDRNIFDQFGPIPQAIRNEDELLPFRAVLLNGIEMINEPLLYYRRHKSNLSLAVKLKHATSYPDWLKLYLHSLRNRIANYNCCLKDIETAKRWIGAKKAAWAQNIINSHLNRLDLQLQYMINPSFRSRILLAKLFLRSSRITRAEFFMLLSPYLLYIYMKHYG